MSYPVHAGITFQLLTTPGMDGISLFIIHPKEDEKEKKERAIGQTDGIQQELMSSVSV